MQPVTTWRSVRVRRAGELGAITAEVHDAYVDLDTSTTDAGILTVPRSRGTIERGWVFWKTSLGSGARRDARLVVRGVLGVKIEDDQWIGTYTINHFAWDDEMSAVIRLQLNEGATLVVQADGVDVEIAPIDSGD